MKHHWICAGMLTWLVFCPGTSLAADAPRGISARLADLLSELPRDAGGTGILYDRVLSLADPERHNGTAAEQPATPGEWRQLYDEFRRAASPGPGEAWPSLAEIRARGEADAARGVVRLAVINLRYSRIREDALDSGALVVRGNRLVLGDRPAPNASGPFVTKRIVAMTPLHPCTYRGGQIAFRLDARDFFSNAGTLPAKVEIDFDDGRGFVSVALGDEHIASYATTGQKTLRLRIPQEGLAPLEASALFEVRALQTPLPDDTLHVTATIPYAGGYATGDAYVYLSPGHTTIIEPVVVIEGFDYDNTMNWDELYALLNRQELIERLRSLGFDAIVLNFTDAVDYIQRNGFVAVELLQQTEETVPAGTTIAVAGASMGGLIGRYALCYMEAHAMPAAVRTFLAFDSPHNGANIPLGLQYWLAFFADDSPDAAALLAALDTPGARQMLVYHHTDPPGATGESDPLRAQFLADLAAVGDYPDLPRTVAIANGSGAGANEGFAAGEQIILWEYYSFLVDIIGNVWAVPQAGSQQILQGMIDIILLPPDELDVTVAGTRPYDNAPGGWRASMAEMDATPAPYGDIIALYPSHCFIPTVSALAVDTADLFYDIAGDPDLLSHTPFDAVYFPAENQEHVDLTAENAQWFIDEIVQGATGIADDPLAGRDSGVGGIADGMRIDAVCPHPVTASACVRFHLPQAGRASLALYDPAGRRIALLVQGECEAGEREAHWNGLDDRGARVASGMYFLRLVSAGASASRRIVVR